MGRRIYSLIFFLLSCCGFKKHVQPINCSSFCEGDVWLVEEFRAEPYPTLIPFEKDELVSALEQDLFVWNLGRDSLTLVEINGKGSATFKYNINSDTLLVYAHNGAHSKLFFKNKSANSLHLQLIGLFNADVYLKRQE